MVRPVKCSTRSHGRWRRSNLESARGIVDQPESPINTAPWKADGSRFTGVDIRFAQTWTNLSTRHEKLTARGAAEHRYFIERLVAWRSSDEELLAQAHAEFRGAAWFDDGDQPRARRMRLGPSLTATATLWAQVLAGSRDSIALRGLFAPRA
jgi:hypothetical protein